MDACAGNMWAGTGSIDVAYDQFQALNNRPQVVLLGSSLIVNPFWLMDHLIDPSGPDIFHYHGSIALERALAGRGLKDQHVFDLAGFGQMISDAYIWA
ncbi:MAG: hypothetical protein ACRD72_22960, partial [Candidatus Angelobacter sp.]